MSFYVGTLAVEAARIEELREAVRIMSRARGRERRRLEARIEEDVGALGLVLLGLLIEKGTITRGELLGHLQRVDRIDGGADGKVTPQQVRAALGIAPPDPGPPPAPAPTRSRRRARRG